MTKPKSNSLRMAAKWGIACLLLGAATSIVLAWIVALQRNWEKPFGKFMSTEPDNNGSYSDRTVWAGLAHLRIAAAVGWVHHSDPLPLAPNPSWGVPDPYPPNARYPVDVAAFGWPCLALRCWCESDRPLGSSSLRWGMVIVPPTPRTYALPFRPDFDGVVPLRPILRGLLTDSAVFGVAWAALLLIPAITKRSLRRRRGLCPRCAYDLRADFTQGCPECGWNKG